MNIEVKIMNPNPCGSNEFFKFNSIKDFKIYLNEELYYSSEVYLNIPSLSNFIKYSEINDLASLAREARFFKEHIDVYIEY